MASSTVNGFADSHAGQEFGKQMQDIWFHEESDLTGSFRSDRVWNQFQRLRWFLFASGLESFRIEWGDVMKKLFGSSFPTDARHE